MRDFSIDIDLRKSFDRLKKRDYKTYDILMRKISEILNCADVNHYKNLRSPLQHLKRVHVNGPFVLTFKYVETEDKIIFYEFDHHDNVYN
jgi:YafQ family addiction module toxin component